MMNKNLLEERLHGDTMFPMRVYTVDYLDGGVIFNLHWHPEYEFIYVEEGVINLQVDTKHVILNEGDSYFICGEQLHASYPVKGNSFKLHTIVFHADMIKSMQFDRIDIDFIQKLNTKNFPDGVFLKRDHTEQLMINMTESYFKKRIGFEVEVKGYLFLLISHVFRYTPKSNRAIPRADHHKIALIKKVINYINDHLSENITIKDLSFEIQMSEGHFNRFFKEIINMTPMTYINMIRINKACEQLKTTDDSITKIALDVGFNSHSYFTRTFKKQKGISPHLYRKSRHTHLPTEHHLT